MKNNDLKKEVKYTNQSHCPFCDSDNLKPLGLSHGYFENYWLPILCLDCGRKSKEHYKLVYFETIREDK